MVFTRRQLITAAAYGCAGKWPSQKALARQYGISQSAISQRLTNFERKLTPQQLEAFRHRTRRGYRAALRKAGKTKVGFKTITVRFGGKRNGE